MYKTDFIISSNKKYGSIGKNGIGKSTIIDYIIKQKELNNVSKYLVSQELHIDDEYSDEYCEIMNKLDGLNFDKEKSKIYKILHGLGLIIINVMNQLRLFLEVGE